MKAINRKEALVNAKANGTLDGFKPLTREEAFTKKALELGGGASSWNDLTDRPFGEKSVTHIDNYTQDFVLDKFGSTETTLPYSLFFVIEEDKEYVVIFDGVEYKCKSQLLGNRILCIGNTVDLSLNGVVDTGEPFVLTWNRGASDYYINLETEETGKHTISVFSEKTIPLDYKYMPDGYPKIELETYTLVEETTVTIADASQPINNPFELEIVDQTYLVTFDGTAYECAAYIAPGPNTLSIGNGVITGTGGGNGEPFFCTVHDGTVMFFAETAGEHTVKIESVAEIITPIDEKYLPPIASPNGTQYKLTVSDDGTLSATKV